MTILTVKCDPSDFVRVIGSFDQSPSMDRYNGKVGRTMSHGKGTRDTHEMFFVQLHGVNDIKVFNAKQIEYITEKEYFKGCLRG